MGRKAIPAASANAGAGGATPGNLGGILGGASVGDMLSGGLRELMDAFKQKGQGDTADSWVARGPNKQIAPPQLEQAIGADCCKLCPSKPGCRAKKSLQDSPKICPTRSTNIPPKAASRAQRTFPNGAPLRRPASRNSCS